MKDKKLSAEDWDEIKKIADVYAAQTTTGADIYLICPKTTIGPQELAMIQALYSRDPKSILSHLLEVARKGADKFMAQFYVNYGHKSIGDCGSILLAFEGVSMLAAKAIQDSQLYAGQEASTRYMDFSNQVFLSPNDNGRQPLLFSSSSEEATMLSQQIQERYRNFYLENLKVIQQHVMNENPYESFDFTEMLAQNSKLDTHALWLKTMKARAFDIARGFLPAGATTSLAWWTSISHCGDHLSWLRCHALPEISELAMETEKLLKEVYSSSFTRKVYDEREAYKKKWFETEYYLEVEEAFSGFACEVVSRTTWAHHYHDMVMTRPQGVELPWQIGEAISVIWTDTIDFGSWRDQQRHRAVLQRMGLLTTRYGMHEWYLQSLPADVLNAAIELIELQIREIEKLVGVSKYEVQYLIPMGMKVPTRTVGSLSKFMYLIELRCQTTVHPTMHANTHRLAQSLRGQLGRIFNCEPEAIPMYIEERVG